ncbi:MAG TPA: hypothetical protein VKY85_05230 [Candidatus Angelobacter sp.]|jgi:hypothetical protein|nr:hypothetical protein [Candidatus Angelobacter sp.]
MADIIQGEKQYIDAFFKLTLRPTAAADVMPLLNSLSRQQRQDFADLADSNHVVIRVFEVINRVAGNLGSLELQAWAVGALTTERGRIANALRNLKPVCDALDEEDCPVTVMKTLDHWPDLGNDLDLVSTARSADVVRVFTQRLQARMEARSWGDRLASKWNFTIPGLRESIETHIGRLGQTGEHTELAQRFIDRRTTMQINGLEFFVPAPEERIFAATLQRMYRHFYFRVCDILNAASLVDSGQVNFLELRNAARQAGIWPGVASFLKIVSQYVNQYRGFGLSLPAEIDQAATVGADKMYTRGRFLRLPIVPYGAKLFARQITQMAMSGNVPATLRLSLLPPLASAAAVASKITGSDKGVW